MKKHTKKLALLAAVLMAAVSMTALTACGGGEPSSSDNGDMIESNQTESSNDNTITGSSIVVDLTVESTDLKYFTWEINDDNSEVEITGYLSSEEGAPAVVVVPSHIQGLPVTEIGMEAFYMSRLVTSVTLPETVESIGVKAFAYCENLETVKLSKNLNYLGKEAFAYCTKLTNLNLEETALTNIDYYVFTETALTEVILPNTLTDLDSTFSGENLKKVVIPGSLTHVRDGVVSHAENLTELVIEDGITSIAAAAFDTCPMLTTVTLPDSVTEIGPYVFVDCPNVSVVYKGVTYENVSYSGTEAVYTEGNKALYKAVNGTELVED